MPRTYGTTNVMPYAAPPPVGQQGDEYWNTATKQLNLSDGTQWNPIVGGGGGSPYVLVTLTAPTVAGSPYLVTHNLNTTTVMVQIFDAVTGNAVNAQVHILNANQVQVSVAANMPNNVNVIVGGGSTPGSLSNFAYTQTVPPLSANSPFTVTHNLNTTTPVVQLWDQVTGLLMQAQVRAPSVNTIQITVTQATPNSATVVVVGSAAALAPIAPANYATQSYVDTHNVPPPVTSGSGVQSFTDAQGMVWVAANGVNAGAWKLAKDVLHARYYRNAALTLSAGAWKSVPMDTRDFDDYGLYTTSTGYFLPPLAGMWQLVLCVTAAATATAQWLQPGIVGTTSSYTAQGLYHASGAYSVTGYAQVTRRLPSAGSENFYASVACSTALALGTGTTVTWFEMHYLGTG
jgi:hypothetical protein